MEVVSIHEKDSVERAVNVIKNGGVIVFPTDTAYGLGVDALNERAVEKVFAIKKREGENPIPVLVGDVSQVRSIVLFNHDAEKLAQAYWPGPLTLVLSAKDDLLAHVIHGQGTVGIRIPHSVWCQAFLKEAGCPITGTSANASGLPPEYLLAGVQKSLGSLANLVDLWVDGGELGNNSVSTVVKIVEGVEVKRIGAISSEEIYKVLE